MKLATLKDGTREFLRAPFDFDIVHQFVENNKSVLNLKLPKVPVRRLLFEAPENARGIWEVAELEIYGIGFAPQATYATNTINLGAPASLGDLVFGYGLTEGEPTVCKILCDDDYLYFSYFMKDSHLV